jgi:lipoyl-dependent peroxiredoxin
MASFARHVDVEWNGNLMEGNGTAKAGTGAFSLPVTFPSRINERGDGKTTPEELLAGAHAVCYAMVLANTIGKQGGKARRLRVTSTVTGERSDAGLKVVSSALKAVVEGLEGIDPGGISELAKNAEKGCPISNAIRGNVSISVDASAS